MNLLLQIILFLGSIVIGGILVDLLKRRSNIKLLLSFSGGFLLTIIFTHILPESYAAEKNTGLFILMGFLLQVVLEYFSKGAEHGHTHLHDKGHSHAVRFPIAIFISLCIHAFVESIPLNHLGESDAHNHSSDLFWAVFIHKIPVAIALKTILDASGLSKVKAWTYLMIFGLTAPLGLLIGDWVSNEFNISLTWLLAAAVGMFFHVATTIIFESSEGHKINFYKLMAILAGFAVGIAIV